MGEKTLLKISELAERGKVLPSTIRHYTDLGLLKPADTTEGGHRLYDSRESIAILAHIRRLTRKGMTLDQIRKEISEHGVVPRILVVDDEPEVCEFIRDLLKDKVEAELRFAHDGFEAGRALKEMVPDLVLLDLMLPGINGFEVCKKIKTDPHLEDTKVLAITGYDSPENRKKILEAGADELMAKPMEAGELLRKIRYLLGEPTRV